MPKYRLTRNAVEQSLKKWKDYLSNNDNLEDSKKLDDSTIIFSCLNSVNNQMLTESTTSLFSLYNLNRKKEIEQILNEGKNEEKLVEADKNFHNDYDSLVSDFISNILIAREVLDSTEDKEINFDKYEEEYKTALSNLKKITNIDNKQFDAFMEIFNESQEPFKDVVPFLEELDEEVIDDYKDIENVVVYNKALEKEEKLKKEREIEEAKKAEVRARKREENNDSLNKTFDVNDIQKSIEHFEKEAHFDSNRSLIDNVFNEINNYKIYKEQIIKDSEIYNTDPSDKLLENKANEKKTYFAGYIKIKENYDKKNWFMKIFSFSDRKAMKTIKDKITTKYGMLPENFDKVTSDYIKDKDEKEKTALENSEVKENKPVRKQIEGEKLAMLKNDVEQSKGVEVPTSEINKENTIVKNNKEI